MTLYASTKGKESMIEVNIVDKRSDQDRVIRSGQVLEKKYVVDTVGVRVYLETDMGYRTILIMKHDDLNEMKEMVEAYLTNLENKRQERASKRRQAPKDNEKVS